MNLMNLLNEAAMSEYVWKSGLKEMTDYKPFTTFWSDFYIAEVMEGEKGVKETFKRAFESWKGDYKYLTELVMVLNNKIWYFYERNDEMAKLYDALWREADAYACETLKGEEAEYYYRVLD